MGLKAVPLLFNLIENSVGPIKFQDVAQRSIKQHSLFGILVLVPREEQLVGAGQGRRIVLPVARLGAVKRGS